MFKLVTCINKLFNNRKFDSDSKLYEVMCKLIITCKTMRIYIKHVIIKLLWYSKLANVSYLVIKIIQISIIYNIELNNFFCVCSKLSNLVNPLIIAIA